jgi:UDP-N-acetylmuramyl pentapeptide phosphotransferase/UDP-N-acetylglucosamine-1-phosphate transferase
MSGIDYRRVLLGGLAASAGLAVVYLLLHDLIGDTPARAESLVAFLVLGPVLTWLYAALRPRFGKGWRTAVLASALVWFLMFLLPFYMLGAWTDDAIRPVNRGQLLLSTIVILVVVIAAGLLGGWLYREAGDDVQGLAPLPLEDDEEDADVRAGPDIGPDPFARGGMDSAATDADDR